jgi:hypothetical protein
VLTLPHVDLSPPPGGQPPAAGVVVQRQVVVGAGTPGRSVSAVPRKRPAPSIPYVVKEGIHPGTEQPPRPRSSQAAAVTPPPVPVPPHPPPVPAAARPARAPAAPASAELAGDKSLDEVILAYLSQTDAKE